MLLPISKPSLHALVSVFLLLLAMLCPAQTTPKTRDISNHLPYDFSNFVWWNPDELRGLLKKQISGLGDEIAPDSAMKGRIREALTALLRAKGIRAEVQSFVPSDFELTAQHLPNSPAPAIVFSIASPQILLDTIKLSATPQLTEALLADSLRRYQGKAYGNRWDWRIRLDVQEALEAKGYLESQTNVAHSVPQRVGDHYVVNLQVTVNAGPQYRIAAISADGGPLLEGRDLSPYFTEKPGDIAGPGPFGRLAGELRAVYWHYGYADVEIHAPDELDRVHATVSYHLEVVPGPVYHLRNLTIHNLRTEQEQRARELLGMHSGDVFDSMAINGLYHKLAGEPLLTGYSFTFSPQKDTAAAQMDLTLDFYRESDKSSVSVQ